MFLDKKTHNNYRLVNKHSCHVLRHGIYGIKICAFNRLTQLQLNSLNRSVIGIIRKFKNKKSIKFWNLIFLDLNLTKLSPESRMGKGKGTIFSKAVFLRPGRIIFEFEGLNYQQASSILFKIKKLSNLKLELVKK
uniref:Ribosomal protein L16 n=1 Tax=Eucheuma denticulatum TaxID=305493 RepID=A0A2H4QI50_9FLOR|nr:ribosomal protein L16 [Eucheuma denticulatum]ATX68847.1 ribosomal protein L16 [Eucheuma denticulatum]